MHIQLKKLKPYAILLLIMVIAYLPVSSFYFGMKNDAFSVNFPNKFFFTEAIRSGRLPLWNPYMNYGFPVYADMGFAFYNPITWLFAGIGYNAYTLTLEVLLYIYLGGVFMFRLGKFFRFDEKISVVVAAMYMCSGFYAGCLQYINFLTAAAFLPLVIHTFLKLIDLPNFKNSFLFAIACYFVFAGGHPAMPIVLIYFLAVLLLLIFAFNKPYRHNYKKILFFTGAGVICSLILYLPAIYSYLTIFPVYGRNAPAQQELYTDAGFTPASYISFLFPFCTVSTKNIFNTDATMRNGFFSIAGFICALIALKSKQQYVRIFFLCALFMLLLSLGGPVKAFIYNRLPLLDYIRYNGEFRVFAILSLAVCVGFGLQQLKTGDIPFKNTLKLILRVLLGVCICLVVILTIGKYFSFSEIIDLLRNNTTWVQKIKLFYAGPFSWFLMVSILIATFVTVFSLYALKKNNLNLFLLIIIADLIVNCLLYLPYTGVGQVTLKDIQAVYNTSPRGIPIPSFTPVGELDTLDVKTTGLVGDISFYNKQVGLKKLTGYPSWFSSTNNYFLDEEYVAEISKKPYLFTKNADTGLIKPDIIVQSFSPRNIELTVNTSNDDTLVLLQNNYKFWNAEINGNKTPINSAYGTFISIKVNRGMNTIHFYYEDKWLAVFILISMLTFLIGISIIINDTIIYRSIKPNQ